MAVSTKPEDRLAQLMQRMFKLRLAEIPRLDYDLSFSQMEILWFVMRSPKCRVQEIADGLGITPPSVSVALQRLEKAGWLERHPDPQDGRATCSSLTEMSVEMLQRVQSAQYRGIEQFLTGLSPKEKEQLINLLGKAISAAEARKQEMIIK
jgi:DNA-binding MarR family transcriptional regulator